MTRTATTEMEVTSIRLERDLKERLKAIAGDQGYQVLVRDILWKFVQQHSAHSSELAMSNIRATMSAVAQQDEQCVVSGELIRCHEPMLLGLTTEGMLVPLSPKAVAHDIA